MSKNLVTCFKCKTQFLRDLRHINETLKLNLNSYCSSECFSLAKNKQKNLICENTDCKNTFKRAQNNISSHNFCSRSCAAIFNNTRKWGPPKPKVILTENEKIARRLAASSLGGTNRWKNYQ